MKINTKNILQNKFVLYLVFFLSLVSVFGYITTSNFQAVLLFVLISLLTNYFSKNMIVILGAAVIGTNLVSSLISDDIEILTIDVDDPKISDHYPYFKSVDIKDKQEYRRLFIEFYDFINEREKARDRHGWIMDTYLIKKC